LPRIIIAFILGIAISTPLEVRILKTEIDAELQKKQDKYLIELNQNTDEQKEMEMKAKKDDLAKVEKEQMDRLNKASKLGFHNYITALAAEML
jgi:sRNA-binding carbon storage regulator CsrA